MPALPPPPSPPAMITAAAQLGPALLAARESAGLTQAAVARRARVGIRFLSELENGKQTARLDKVLAVVRALGLAIAFFPTR